MTRKLWGVKIQAPDQTPLTIRAATRADAERLELLAQLDEAELPSAPALLAFVGDELWVAVSLATGAVIADPFRPSAQVTALVTARARQLTGPARRRWGFGSSRARRSSKRTLGFGLETT